MKSKQIKGVTPQVRIGQNVNVVSVSPGHRGQADWKDI